MPQRKLLARGGYYGDRGNVNYNRNVNVSSNEINIDRGGVFSQNNLKATQQRASWQPNPRHRRGQAYPEAVKQRLGRIGIVAALQHKMPEWPMEAG